MRRSSAGLLAAMLVVACKYSPAEGPSDGNTIDAPPILPDAGPCEGASAACFSDGNGGTVLQTCAAAGEDPVTTPCAWGCVSAGTAHCGELQPSGGALTADDLDDLATLLPITIAATTTINTDTGEITGLRAPGPDVASGIEYIDRGTVGVFRMRQLTINQEVSVVGSKALALVALEGMQIDEELDARGPCTGTDPGPGGFAGGTGGMPGGGPATGVGGGSAGVGVNDDSSGGAGGGYGGTGGNGGGGATEDTTAGGTIFGDDVITALVGGGGGGGGGNAGGDGGGGGGAVQLVSNGAIVFGMAGEVFACGCGGKLGGDKRGGGGGGAGGALLVEAPSVTLAADSTLAANGGGGGGGDNPGEGAQDGEDGKSSDSIATGGNGGSKGGQGGDGGILNTPGGRSGGNNRDNGGGGGGAVGWIRVNTLSGAATLATTSVISPAFGTASSSQGVARVE